MSLRWARWSNILTKGGSSLSPVTATMSCLCLWVTRKCLNHQDLDICEKHDFLSILLRFNGGKTVYWQQQAARAAQAGPNKNSVARQASPHPVAPHTSLHQENLLRTHQQTFHEAAPAIPIVTKKIKNKQEFRFCAQNRSIKYISILSMRITRSLIWSKLVPSYICICKIPDAHGWFGLRQITQIWEIICRKGIKGSYWLIHQY